MRPTLFYPVWIFFLAGFHGGRYFNGPAAGYAPGAWFWIMLGVTLVMGGTYVLNQIQDQETDRINGKLFLLANGIISVKGAYIQAAVVLILGILAGWAVHVSFGVMLLFLAILAGWFYNYPPTVWKDHPIMGMVVNAVGGAIIYYLGWMVHGGWHALPWPVLSYTLAVASVYINTTLPDREGDEKTGKITFGVRFGVKVSAVVSLVLETLAVLCALWFRDWLLFIPAAVMLPFFVVSLMKPSEETLTRATKYSVLALAVAVCVKFPYFLIPVFFVFYFTKWYYKARFNFNYPSFKAE